jgi:hypothetical protein
MATVRSICDRALSLVGASDLRSLDSGWKNLLEAVNYDGLAAAYAPREALACVRHFAQIRDALLETYPWIFARKSAALAQLASSFGGWKYSYTLPSDCAKLLDLTWERFSIERWEQAGSSVGCEYKPVTARYTAKITAPASWPAIFETVMTARLAAHIYPIVSPEFKGANALEAMAMSAISEGYRVGAIDPVRRPQSHSYRWDKYSNDWSSEYLGGETS